MKEFKKIYKWIIAIIGVFGIFSAVFLWIRNDQKKDDYIQQVIFSSPEQRMATEKYMVSSFSEGAMIEAKLEMTAYYKGLTTAIDTLTDVHKFVYTVLETSKLRNEAILNLVHRMDSIITVMDKENKQIKSDVFTIKTFSEALLREIGKLKALENFSGD